MAHEAWPPLPLSGWESTYRALHRWTQIVGRIRMSLAPPVNHWWHVTLYVDERGLTTSPMPHRGELVTLRLDLRTHRLIGERSDGSVEAFPLGRLSVADFYERCCGILGLDVPIPERPAEVVDRTPFPEDRAAFEYNEDAVRRLHRILVGVERTFQQYRGGFVGKSSPVHFFWGAFDLAVTRFSGRRNPKPPSDPIGREAYSHEVISHGFWPGGDWPNGERVTEPVFYAYAAPEPAGFSEAQVPADATYEKKFGEYFLPYEAVRRAREPEALLREFMDRTYEAGARLARWQID